MGARLRARRFAKGARQGWEVAKSVGGRRPGRKGSRRVLSGELLVFTPGAATKERLPRSRHGSRGEWHSNHCQDAERLVGELEDDGGLYAMSSDGFEDHSRVPSQLSEVREFD